jgi:HAD superfamily hydrolase (TIGR01458 family)
MSAILFDLDGVLYEGDTAIKGAADAVAWFTENDVPHLFLTNTTSRPRSALAEKLSRFGISTKPEQFLTPPLAAAQLLKQQQRHRLALFIPTATQGEFSDFEIVENDDDPVDAVVIGDLADNWDFLKLNRAFRLLMNNPAALLLALGMTRYWRATDGLQLDAGPFVKALEYASGRTPVVTGKPAADFYQAAIGLLGEHNTIYMIGDDIIGDIEAAQHAGLHAILVRTGKFSESDLSSAIRPDTVLNSVADLPAWWTEHVLHST